MGLYDNKHEGKQYHFELCGFMTHSRVLFCHAMSPVLHQHNDNLKSLYNDIKAFYGKQTKKLKRHVFVSVSMIKRLSKKDLERRIRLFDKHDNGIR